MALFSTASGDLNRAFALDTEACPSTGHSSRDSAYGLSTL